jgi:hypothetical protein
MERREKMMENQRMFFLEKRGSINGQSEDPELRHLGILSCSDE